MNALVKGTPEYRKFHIKEMQAWSLDQKINHSLKRIQEFYKEVDGKIYVAFSGGKDSTVLLHLVRSLYPDAVAVFSNTTNEFVEILEFIRKIPNIITVHPKMTFNETVKKFGFPLVSKKVARMITDLRENKPTTFNTRNLYLTGFNSKGVYTPSFKLAAKWHSLIDVKFDITSKCCDILKKEPLHRFEKESGLFPIIGTQANEGGYRKSSWVKEGCNIINKGTNMSRPLSIWVETDIWEYIARYSLPYSEIYDDVIDVEDGQVLIKGEVRTGCAYCAFGSHLETSSLLEKNRFERLSVRKPKQYKKMMQLKNNGVSFQEALRKVGVNT